MTTADRKKTWGCVCIVVGGLVLIGVARESGKQQEQSLQFDRSLNRWIEKQNRWKPGTMDEQYEPGTTWTLGRGPSAGVTVGCVLSVFLIVAGIVMLISSHQDNSALRDD